ncbi:amidohydrolase [Pseudomonas capeferrum]|uniref:amidohydrolase family protein n=1 Tax=Pseudomonas capeferrum TaxID=1495066 RepID=UPI0015E3413F|nr:amidohydrolase family protein [Pseudomonas capeferrum]MBA1204831.1 amidohydrolase [Pseudomonas capeferrum]
MTQQTPSKAAYRRIATEEAFAPREMIDIYRRMTADKVIDDPGFNSMWSFYLSGSSARGRFIIDGLTDMEHQRIAHMDAAGIDMQVLSLTSPGVQIMDRAEAVSFAGQSNDWLADAISRHPTRLAGLAAVAPQDPQAAAREIQRGVTELGLKGVIINSHTHGEYLSDPKFWDIFEAAQALDVPIYLHPMTPPKNMIEPLLECGLDGAIFGFGMETGMHALRIITAGVFDRFPKLQMILGHMGEALPFWMFRLDYMHAATVRSERYDSMRPLQRKPSDYLKQNFHITNSGMAWEPAVKFTQEQIGVDRVMYAMDYPYQYDPAEVIALDAMDISDEAKKKFFETNATRLFKLD